MGTSYTHYQRSLREMSNKKDRYAIAIYKLGGVVGYILHIISSTWLDVARPVFCAALSIRDFCIGTYHL